MRHHDLGSGGCYLQKGIVQNTVEMEEARGRRILDFICGFLKDKMM